MGSAERCLPCEDGRKLVVLALAARGLSLWRGVLPPAPELSALLLTGALLPVLVYRALIHLQRERGEALLAGALCAVDPFLRGAPASACAVSAAGLLLAAVLARHRFKVFSVAALALLAGLAAAWTYVKGDIYPALEPVLALLLGTRLWALSRRVMYTGRS